jgi:hypothetical protein
MAVTSFHQWGSLNDTRAYPLDDIATLRDNNGIRLPESLIADLQLWWPMSYGTRAYISAIGVTPALLSAVFVATNIGVNDLSAAQISSSSSMSGSLVTPLAAVSVTRPHDAYRSYEVTPLQEGVGGWVAFGNGSQRFPFETGQATELSWRFSDPRGSLLLPRVAVAYPDIPISSLGKSGWDTSLRGIVGLEAGADLEIVEGWRYIDGVYTRCAVIRLIDTPIADLYEVYAGQCGNRPENKNCGPEPIRSIGGVVPDCAGNVTIVFDTDLVDAVADDAPGLLLTTPLGTENVCGKVLQEDFDVVPLDPEDPYPDPIPAAPVELSSSSLSSSSAVPEVMVSSSSFGGPITWKTVIADNFERPFRPWSARYFDGSVWQDLPYDEVACGPAWRNWNNIGNEHIDDFIVENSASYAANPYRVTLDASEESWWYINDKVPRHGVNDDVKVSCVLDAGGIVSSSESDFGIFARWYVDPTDPTKDNGYLLRFVYNLISPNVNLYLFRIVDGVESLVDNGSITYSGISYISLELMDAHYAVYYAQEGQRAFASTLVFSGTDASPVFSPNGEGHCGIYNKVGTYIGGETAQFMEFEVAVPDFTSSIESDPCRFPDRMIEDDWFAANGYGYANPFTNERDVRAFIYNDDSLVAQKLYVACPVQLLSSSSSNLSNLQNSSSSSSSAIAVNTWSQGYVGLVAENTWVYGRNRCQSSSVNEYWLATAFQLQSTMGGNPAVALTFGNQASEQFFYAGIRLNDNHWIVGEHHKSGILHVRGWENNVNTLASALDTSAWHRIICHVKEYVSGSSVRHEVSLWLDHAYTLASDERTFTIDFASPDLRILVPLSAPTFTDGAPGFMARNAHVRFTDFAIDATQWDGGTGQPTSDLVLPGNLENLFPDQ